MIASREARDGRPGSPPSHEYPVRPLAWLGIALIVAGCIVAAMGGVSFTKKRNAVEVGPLRLATVEKGFVPPMVGVVTIIVGVGLLFAGRRRA